MRCMRIAAAQVELLTAVLRAALKAHELARVAARVRRHTPPAAAGAPPPFANGIRPLNPILYTLFQVMASAALLACEAQSLNPSLQTLSISAFAL